ncbi:MAG: hypothetical protein ACE37K_25150 [Planctomycetota bacterium]
MMRPALTGLLLLTGTSVLLAQDELRIADFDNSPMTWGQTTEAGYAAIRYDELPGEFTLLMVHTTVDETVCGTVVAEGLTTALPFMVQPTKANWTLDDTFLAAASNITYTGFAPMVPPRRIANYVNHFTGLGYPTGYGTDNEVGTTWQTHEMDGTTVTSPLGPADERNPWWHSSWSTNPTYGVEQFYSSGLGRESVLQAAHEFVPLVPGAPPLDENSIAILNTMMDSSIGFEIYVQAIHIKKPDPQGDIDVRLSRHVRIRRRSLGQQTTGWALAKGPERHVPSPVDDQQRWYFGPLGGEMHVQFPTDIASLEQPSRVTAYFTLIGGGIQTVQQTPNPLGPTGELLAPNMGIFIVPLNCAPGTQVYFEHERAPGAVLAPVGASGNGGAWIVPYTVPANPAPPSLP